MYNLKIKERNRTYYLKNREKLIAQNKKYYFNNLKQIKKKQKKRREENKNTIKTTNKKWREQNKDYIKTKSKKYYSENRIKILQREKDYRKNNKELFSLREKKRWERDKIKRKKVSKKWREKNKIKIQEKNKLYYKKNKIKIQKKVREYESNKLKTDPMFKFKHNFKSLIRIKLKNKLSSKKGENTFNFLPYTINELIHHLEDQFKPGMTWNNHGIYGWHIDHIIPDSLFKYKSVKDKAFQESWSLSNLQPLWAEDNLRKSNKNMKYYGGKNTMLQRKM